MRALAILFLVLLVLLTGLPVAMAGGSDCPSCLSSDGLTGGALACAAILVLFTLALPVGQGIARSRRQSIPVFFLTKRVERPPRG